MQDGPSSRSKRIKRSSAGDVVDLGGVLDSIASGETLGRGVIEVIVRGVVDGSLSDAEVEGFLRAVFENDLCEEDTVSLTDCMMRSGEMLEWPEEIRPTVVDKHSTGGVGDKVSIPLAPALAACGVHVPMISGRGLGHTGGTLDKLESIQGFNVERDSLGIVEQVTRIGVAMVGQTPNLVPADRRMYAIRDVTGTVASIPLITASIVSKKAAERPSALVLDVKHGRAAFMTEREDALDLAKSMVSAAGGCEISTVAVLTTMDHPLGCAIGNAVEIVESVECLRGTGPDDLEEVVCTLGGVLLEACGKAPDAETGSVMVLDALTDGSAFNRFVEMAVAQGANADDFESEASLLRSLGLLDDDLAMTEITTNESGWVADIDALALAQVALDLGAGRRTLGDCIDHAVGLILDVQVGEWLDPGDSWVTVLHRGNLSESSRIEVEAALVLSADSVEPSSRIDAILSQRDYDVTR